MDTVTRFEPRRVIRLETANALQPDPRQRLAVTATYLLSEEGRKGLAPGSGGNGRALQELTIQVPANRLHLVTVDAKGRAHLKLRPRFELNAEQRVVQDRFAADLRRAADRGRSVSRGRAQSSARTRVSRRTECRTPCPARGRPAAPRRSRRIVPGRPDATRHAPAVAHRPSGASSTHRTVACSSMSGRIDGSARLVPPEAYRRWRADLRARERMASSARRPRRSPHTQHKKQVVADWVAQYGTPQQQARHAAGVLPMEEVIEAMTDQAFDAGDRFRAVLLRRSCATPAAAPRSLPQYASAVVTPARRHDLQHRRGEGDGRAVGAWCRSCSGCSRTPHVALRRAPYFVEGRLGTHRA